jgi:hypothetical protein
MQTSTQDYPDNEESDKKMTLPKETNKALVTDPKKWRCTYSLNNNSSNHLKEV